MRPTSLAVMTSGGDMMMFGPGRAYHHAGIVGDVMHLLDHVLGGRGLRYTVGNQLKRAHQADAAHIADQFRRAASSVRPASNSTPRAAALEATFSRLVSASVASAAAAPTGWPE